MQVVSRALTDDGYGIGTPFKSSRIGKDVGYKALQKYYGMSKDNLKKPGALDRLRQKLHVRLLRLVFVSGAPDPYDTALAFGCVNAALGALTPLAERTLCIDERDIQTGVDFDAERPRIDARIVCTIRIGQIVAVALIFGAGYLKQKLQAKKARAARAKTAPDTQERKVSNG